MTAAAHVEAPAASVRRSVAVVTVLATFLAFLDATVVNVAFPSLEASFAGASRSELSWVLNAYNVVFAALLLPAGRLGDVLSHRTMFFVGVAVFTVASTACAAATSVETLIAARVVQAAGAAIVMPTALALLLSVYPREHRASAVALGGAAAGVAAALGPSLGGVLVDAADWRVIFLINLPIGLFVWWRGRTALPDVGRTASRLPDMVGTLLLGGAVALVAFGLVQGPEWGWGDGRVIGAFVAALVLAPCFVWRTLGHPAPALDLRLLRRGDAAVANAATLAFAAAFFAKILCDVLFLTSVWGYSVVEAGLALSPSPLITAVTAGLAGRLAERRGHRPVVVFGALAYAAGCAWYALAIPAEPSYVGHFLPATLLTGVGIAFALPMLTSAAVTTLPHDEFGAGAGANATARQLGGVLGIALLIAIVGTPAPADALASFHEGWAFIAIAAALTAVVATRLRAAPG